MTTYEACILLRVLPRQETKTVLKRAAQSIFNRGGFLRKLENMGTRQMPFKTSVHGVVYKEASHFLFKFNIPPSKVEDLYDEYGRDVDIIRRRVYKQVQDDDIECTLHEENLPPPYRKTVQQLVKSVKEDDKNKFKYNTGLDYYPFQK